MAWDGERTVTFTMEDALISPVGLSILSGAGLIDASVDTPVITHVTEICQVEDKDINNIPIITLQKKPHITVNNPSIYVMGLNDNGEVITEPFLYTYDGEEYNSTTDTTTYRIALLTNSWGGQTYSAEPNEPQNLLSIKTCNAVLVDYYTSYKSNAFAINITPDKFGGTFYLEASTLWRDQATGKDLPAEFIIPSCKVQSNFSFSLSSSGDPSTFTFTMDAFPDYTRWNKTEKVLATIQILGTDLNNEELQREQTWTKQDPTNMTNSIKYIGNLKIDSWMRYFTVPNSAGRTADPHWAEKIMSIYMYLKAPGAITHFIIYRKSCLDTESTFTAYQELAATDYTITNQPDGKKEIGFRGLDPHRHYSFLIEGYTDKTLVERSTSVVLEARAPLAMGTVSDNKADGLSDDQYAVILSGGDPNLATSLAINFADAQTAKDADKITDATSLDVKIRLLNNNVITQGVRYPAWTGTKGAYNFATISIKKDGEYKVVKSYSYADLLEATVYGTNTQAGANEITFTIEPDITIGTWSLGEDKFNSIEDIYVAVYNDLYKFARSFDPATINNKIKDATEAQTLISSTLIASKR